MRPVGRPGWRGAEWRRGAGRREIRKGVDGGREALSAVQFGFVRSFLLYFVLSVSTARFGHSHFWTMAEFIARSVLCRPLQS